VIELEGRMTDDTIGLKQARQPFDTTVRLTENCHESFINGSPQSKRRWSRAMFAEIVVQDRHIVRHEYQEPSASSSKDYPGEAVLIRISWWT